MTERIPRSVFVAAGLLTVSALAYAAYSRPWYFTSQTYIAGLIFLEFLLAAIWMYRRVFFPVVLITFLLAGLNVPGARGWTSVLRWFVLGLGALVGLLLTLKDRGHDFGFFHLVAFFVVLASLVSAAASQYPNIAFLKVLSLLLLFVYGATGARIATVGRESRFFGGLLTGCEIFVGATAVFYAVGIEVMGNPNSLGAVMALVAPILLWGVLQGGNPLPYRRRVLLYAICIYLAFMSQARAGIAAALVASAVLCVAARKYKLLFEGTTVLVILVAAAALVRPGAVTSLTSSVVYKNGPGEILASRISPWQSAIDNIRDHPWFGMGLGTTTSGGDVEDQQIAFASTSAVTAEHGSSYLAILVGLGIVGAIPTMVLLILLTTKIVRVLWALHKFGSVAHPATVLAVVMIAGMVHAAFEDWMFAPGYYLCVFFWSLAFVFNDLVVPSPRWAVGWRLSETPGAISSRL